MKIALLGARNSVHITRWANALVARGHEVHLFTLHDGGDPIDRRVSVYRIPGAAPAGYILSTPHLKKLLSEVRPRLLHAHYASGYGTLGRLSGFHPYILSVWGSDVYEFATRSLFHREWLRGNLRAADRVCSTSHAMAKQTKAVFPKIKHIAITPFGIDTQQFKPIAKKKKRKYITIGTVKSLEHKYGVDILIRTYAKAVEIIRQSHSAIASRLRLLIIGGGSKRAELEALTQELGIADITTFRGRVAHVEVPNHLNQLDIYLALSRSESFGVAVLEASACEIPVIVSDVGGLPEVVKNGITGFVVRRESIDDAANALVRLVLDEDLRGELGKKGREYVQKYFSWEASIGKMEEVYYSVINKNS